MRRRRPSARLLALHEHSTIDTRRHGRDARRRLSGNRLVLNPATEQQTWPTPPGGTRRVTITGKAIEVSFNAYFDRARQTRPGPAHGEGLTFALIEGDATGFGDNNHPAPVPVQPQPSVERATEYGAGGNGLGFSGFDGNDTTLRRVNNLDGRQEPRASRC